METHLHQQYPPQEAHSGAHAARSSLGEFRAPGQNGSMPPQNNQGPMPVPPQGAMNGNGFPGHMHRNSGMGGPSGFDFSRSPPNNKNTAHVPCKFFRAGNCQAGSACPFSHAIEAINEPAPCKYFAKGNCKFGTKCANPHILPDGRDGRKFNWKGPFASGVVTFNGRNRASSTQFADPLPQAPYTVLPTPLSPSLTYQNFGQEEFYVAQIQPRLMEDLSTNTGNYSVMAGPKYGSPPNDLRLGLSPPVRAMDATLPASFDSQGISHMARYGPAAASLPTTFGNSNFPSTSPTLSSATPSAFGNLNLLATSKTNNNTLLSNNASSPPTTGEDVFPRKLLHSELRSKPQMIVSSSLPGPRPLIHNYQGDDSDGSEEELFRVPGALSDDLLTPSEKMRRFSRPEEDSSGFGTRQSLSGFGSPSDSKVGSPSNASPSSRYGALFARRQREETSNSDGLVQGSISAFGHVGSPLRKSSLQTESGGAAAMSAVSRARSGEIHAFAASSSPVSQRTSTGGLGMLSQQFRKIGLNPTSGPGSNSVADSAPGGGLTSLHPATAGTSIGRGRTSSQSSMATALGIGMGGGTGGAGRMDRTISGGSAGRGHDRIDEECLFSMEEDEGGRKEKERDRENQRLPRPWSVVAAKGVVTDEAQASAGGKVNGSNGVGVIGGQKNESNNL